MWDLVLENPELEPEPSPEPESSMGEWRMEDEVWSECEVPNDEEEGEREARKKKLPNCPPPLLHPILSQLPTRNLRKQALRISKPVSIPLCQFRVADAVDSFLVEDSSGYFVRERGQREKKEERKKRAES